MKLRLLYAAFVLILSPGLASAGTLRQAPDIDLSSDATPQVGVAAGMQGNAYRGPEYKSPGKAFMYSLLLPGLGHHYAGDGVTARRFFVLEAAVWTSLIVFEVQGHLRKDGYEDYAQQFAGIASDDHSDDYWGLLTQYNSSRDYEAQIKSEGRAVLFPDGNATQLDAYFVDNRIDDYEPWEWTSADARRAYQDRRSASKRAFRRGVYTIAVGIANRVASGFFAVKAARRSNERIDGSQHGFRVEFGSPLDRGMDHMFQAGVSVVRDF